MIRSQNQVDNENPYDSPAETAARALRSPWRLIPVAVFGIQGLLFIFGAGVPLVVSFIPPTALGRTPPPISIVSCSFYVVAGMIWVYSAICWNRQEWKLGLATMAFGFVLTCVGGLNI